MDTDCHRRRPTNAHSYLSRGFRLLADNLAIHQEWRRLIVTHNVSGVRVHDARLVAPMRVLGVKRILTFNQKDCAGFVDTEAIHPAAVF